MGTLPDDRVRSGRKEHSRLGGPWPPDVVIRLVHARWRNDSCGPIDAMPCELNERLEPVAVDEFIVFKQRFFVVQPTAAESERTKHALRVARDIGQIGAALEAVITTALSPVDHERWVGLRDEGLSFPLLRHMAPWFAETLNDDELADLVESAFARLDDRIREHIEQLKARQRASLDPFRRKHHQASNRRVMASSRPHLPHSRRHQRKPRGRARSARRVARGSSRKPGPEPPEPSHRTGGRVRVRRGGS